MNQFIDEEIIHQILKQTKEVSKKEINNILDKALLLKGLELKEVAALLNISDKETLDRLFQTAFKIKENIYGNRLVLFAPLYTSNHCSNNCLYCGFRTDNKNMKRRSLNLDEIKEETKIILEQGHKRILMLMGEDGEFDYFLKAIEAVYSVKDSKGNSIRRINIEIAPLDKEEFQKLKNVKIGTYTVFQETYHRETYKKMHPSGKKSDYDWRLNVMDRALKNKINDVGIGALFGLYNYKFEVLALLQHANHLNKTYGIGPHTISIPRIEPAQNAPASITIPNPVSDEDFKKLVAVLRLAVPYTGIILSTRESAEIRKEIFNLGISQISAGSKTNPGGYKEAIINPEDEEQFTLNDTRTTGEIIKSVIKQGFIPSFCTGCYRLGRVGKDFMDLAKPGLIKLRCLPNALTTLKEYLEDYADEETKKAGEELIQRELDNILDKDRRDKTIEYLEKIKNKERDLYF
ncbi:[FeFe] hydrogenase H-cluster radical SAM maturase HydG [Candidatus Woesearchaeota archaeon]|nr:[FeFe] hydrogenase H-cluster radical SAM maturase HydG [Candidatus Woesearchaeota archaeon]